MPIRVAVMGCVVNGPGEAREADLGIAAGKGQGFLDRQRRGHATRSPRTSSSRVWWRRPRRSPTPKLRPRRAKTS